MVISQEVFAVIQTAKYPAEVLQAYWNEKPAGKKAIAEFLQRNGLASVKLPKFPTKSLVGIIRRYAFTCQQAGILPADIDTATIAGIQELLTIATQAVETE